MRMSNVDFFYHLMSNRLHLMFIVFLLGLLGFAAMVEADYPGEYNAELVRIKDGDTFVLDVHTWLDTTVRQSVRVRGMDTPELKAKKQCERVLAIQSKRYAEILLSEGSLTVSNVASRRSFDRVVADVQIKGVNFASLMVSGGHARQCTKCKNGWDWCG